MADHPTIRVVSAEIQRNGRYLLTQRLATAVLADLWEFPGGRVRPDESDEEALRRCLLDRVGIRVTPVKQVLQVEHSYESYDLVMSVWHCESTEAPSAERVQRVAWVAPEDFKSYSFPGADQKTIDQLLSEDD